MGLKPRNQAVSNTSRRAGRICRLKNQSVFVMFMRSFYSRQRREVYLIHKTTSGRMESPTKFGW